MNLKTILKTIIKMWWTAFTRAGSYVKDKYNAMPEQRRRRAKYLFVFIILFLLFRKKVTGAIRKMFHKDINKLEVDFTNLTYERGQYFSMCSTLESAMDGTGTLEDSVNNVIMQLRTQDDWNYLQKCFGIRQKDGGTFNKDITGDLKMWLADDLDEGELEEVRDILNLHGIIY